MERDAQRGGRMREERNRLGLSQQQIADVVDVRREMWAKYETGAEPGASVLTAIAAAGADVLYILTGKRAGDGIGESSVHQAVLDAVDLLSLDKKLDPQQLARAVVKLCQRGTSEPSTTKAKQSTTQIFHAPVKKVAGRDVIIQGGKK